MPRSIRSSSRARFTRCRSGRTPPSSGSRRAAATDSRAALLGAALLALAGCATTPPLTTATTDGDPLALCRALFERVDAEVRRAGVGDAGADRIDDHPWLRINRPLASFRAELDTPARVSAWLDRLGRLDAEGRGAELANLPAAERAALDDEWQRAAPAAGLPGTLAPALADCRHRLNRRLIADPEALQQLVVAAEPADEYVTWQRVVGLYPITRRVVLPPIASHQQARREAIQRQSAAGTDWRRYAVPGPSRADRPLPQALVRDALGIPVPSAAQRAALLSAHAPEWAVETAGAADRPGALVAGEERPRVDPARPAEYRHWSWARFRGEVVVQLSYLIWFPERPPQGAFDIYAGHLDGLIWRVTLDPAGEPLAYESIHPCGCYYTVFPAPGWAVHEPPGSEPVLAPLTVSPPDAGERLQVRLEASTHYVAGVAAVRAGAAATTPLAPLPLDTLRSLPRPDGTRVSAFAPDGLIPSTRRAERFLLWPLGVRSPGAMRQWGTHAVAFVGKRHFDDPYLLDRLLEKK